MLEINGKHYHDADLNQEIKCPFCSGIMDKAIHMGEEQAIPTDGDFAICAGCGEILNYTVENDIISLRKPSHFDIENAKQTGIYENLIETQGIIKNTNHGLRVR